MNNANRNIHIVIDGQFGSTGKGLLSGYLANEKNIDTICTAWAANAGHTFIDKNGRKFIHTMLANGIVGKNIKTVLLGAGSIIDPDNLLKEYLQCEDLLKGVTIAIHPHAAIISQHHRDVEDVSMVAIGSTKKGVGEAAIQRIQRNPMDMNVASVCEHEFIKYHVVTAERYQQLLNDSENILVEGAQGYSLSMYHGFYPYTTSSDVSTHQVLADCCIPYGFGNIEVYGCFRTYPIRVSNRYNDDGKMVGYSGDTYPDSYEISWSDIGQPIELTTVTKLPRRIFTWSDTQYLEAVRICGINHIFVNFMNYLDDEAGAQFLDRIKKLNPGINITYLGYGPTENDVRKNI